jgi:hypothetical protein
MTSLVERMNDLDSETIVRQFLRPAANPDIPDPNQVDDDPEAPELLQLTPRQLLDRVTGMRTGYRVTLNLTDLLPEDVVEILYDCEGLISRLEIFNLKDYTTGKTCYIEEISELQLALNEGNAINLKRVIRRIIGRLATAKPFAGKTERIEKLGIILHDISAFTSMYSSMHLKPRIGSDSTGHSSRMYGMGLAILDTLTPGARRLCKHRQHVAPGEISCSVGDPSEPPNRAIRSVIPFRIPVYKRVTYIPYEAPKDPRDFTSA